MHFLYIAFQYMFDIHMRKYHKKGVFLEANTFKFAVLFSVTAYFTVIGSFNSRKIICVKFTHIHSKKFC